MEQTPKDHGPQDRDASSRAAGTPEEQAAGTQNPHEQAEAILEESEQRTLDPEGTQLGSTQTPDDGRTSEQHTG
jgi:hypothetical protein